MLGGHSTWPAHYNKTTLVSWPAVININELRADLQVYQCCTRSFITPTHLQIHPWQDSALSELTSPHISTSSSDISPASSPPPPPPP